MIRPILKSFFRVVIRIFFRNIEVSGLENVPAKGPIVFVLNHPNALIDPVIMFCFSPREVSFLAKSTLFSMPVISFFVRGFGGIPVYRHQDEGADPKKNLEMFQKVREYLRKDGAIAIFPEGTSHVEPKLRKLKTGATRIALISSQDQPVHVVPCSLFFFRRGMFRSEVVLAFGEPLLVEKREENISNPISQKDVKEWTEKIEKALSKVVLQADEAELVELSRAAQQILGEDNQPLPAQLAQQKRILEAYEKLKVEHPKEITKLKVHIHRYQTILDSLNVDDPKRITKVYSWEGVFRYAIKHLLYFIVLFPLAVVGMIIHFPAYFLTDYLAKKFSKGEMDILATVKLVASLLVYPLLWLFLTFLVGIVMNIEGGIATFLVFPLIAYATLMYLERLDKFRLEASLFTLFLFRKPYIEKLVTEREEIRKKLFDLQALIS